MLCNVDALNLPFRFVRLNTMLRKMKQVSWESHDIQNFSEAFTINPRCLHKTSHDERSYWTFAENRTRNARRCAYLSRIFKRENVSVCEPKNSDVHLPGRVHACIRRVLGVNVRTHIREGVCPRKSILQRIRGRVFVRNTQRQRVYDNSGQYSEISSNLWIQLICSYLGKLCALNKWNICFCEV